MLRNLVFAVALMALCGGGVAADDKREPSELEKAMAALQQPDAEKQKDGVEYILKNSDTTPSFAMLLGAAGAYRLSRLEDAAFLFYAGKLRARVDLERFKPIGTGGNSPEVALGAIHHSLGGAINSAIMREPIVHANVVKRIEGWDPYAKGSYNPGWEGWEYSKTLSEKEARSIGGKYVSRGAEFQLQQLQGSTAAGES